MRLQILALVLCAAAAIAAPVQADVVTTVLSESNGEITLGFANVGTAQAPVAKVFVAISDEGSYSVGFDPGAMVKLDAPPLFEGGEPVDSVRARLAEQADTLRVWAPFHYRGSRVLYFEFDLFRFPAGTDQLLQLVAPTVTVTYDPAPLTNNRQSADPLLRRLVVNDDLFPSATRPSAPDPWFSLAPTWVKIPVSSRGVYAVTGADLVSQGISLSQINDPSTMRMYSRFGLPQPRDYADPSGTWQPGVVMEETAIMVEDGGDGTFDRGDRVIFYGMPASDWADYYDPAAPDTVFKRHAHTDVNYYYLTWDAMLPGTPARMAEVSGAPGAGADVTTYVERLYAEEDLIADFDYGGDGWLWQEIPKLGLEKRKTLKTIDISNLDVSGPQTFRTVALAKYTSPDTTGVDPDPLNINDHTVYYLVDRAGAEVEIGRTLWTALPGERDFEDGRPVRHDGFFLRNGSNRFIFEVPLAPENPNRKDFMSFAWFSLFYHRTLQAVGGTEGGYRGFTSGAGGARTFRVGGITGPGAYVFDVTDMRAPVRITGAVNAGANISFSANPGGERRHYWVAQTSGLRDADVMRYVAVDLRAEATGPNMVIISHDDFAAAAARLRAYRAGNLAHYPSPRVEVVTTREVYDNFSGGIADPMAIRNYIKFIYDNYSDAANNPSLAFVLFLGDANEDYRNAASTQPDFVPSNLYFTRRTAFTFVTDEWYGHLDPGDLAPGQAVLDVALGRLPVTSSEEANRVVDKIIAYETDATFGEWRKQVILAADDELSSNRTSCDVQFTSESESITYNRAAQFIEVDKVYLTEYDRISNIKPASRAAFLEKWNEGALIVNYIGHGSNRQMADEQVFVDSDVNLLNNGRRLPILLALSCTIGDFANYRVKSLSEKLILRQEGGVVGTVTASRETFANLNSRLNFALFEQITAKEPDDEVPTVGEAMVVGKLRALIRSFNTSNQEENNWKYNLLADPALRLRAPRRRVEFDLAAADTLVAGLRKTITGAVYDGHAVDAGFDGSVRVKVREPDVLRQYLNECLTPQLMVYRVPGGVLYEGTTDVTDGRFEVSFRVPRSASRGPLAFITAYADDGSTDAVATLDSTLTLASPTVADSAGLEPLDGPPRVTLGFKSGLETVKPGETLQAVVRDADGINILETTNEGKQAIVFDDLPIPIDANKFFSFDHGGSDTSGVLLFPLPELDFGQHRAIYKVSDAFGQTALDTLVFNVTDPRDFFAQVLFNYPNPFKTDTSFLIRLSDRADIRMDIFTVSGKRVRRLEEARDGGQVWIHWDGRDASGGEIANGVYLYVATVDFADTERTPLVLRGKLAKIE